MKILEIINKTKKDGTPYRLVKLQVDEENVKEGSFWDNKAVFQEGDEVKWTIKQNGDFTNFYEDKITPQEYKRRQSGTTPEIRLTFLEDAVKDLDRRLKLLEPKKESEYKYEEPDGEVPF